MTDVSTRPSTSGSRMEPTLAWTVVTDAPLRGLALAREATRVVAWDEAGGLSVLDERGDRIGAGRAPGPVSDGAVSDDGSLVALLSDDRRLWLFGPDLVLRADRETVPEPLTVAVDPHGRYVAVPSRSARTQLYTCFGRKAGEFETLQPLAHLVFVPAHPRIVGAAGHGSLFGIDLFPAGGGKLDAEVAWRESLLSNVGRLAVTGDGGTILASCFIHGVQRFDSQGRGEGAYHLGGTSVHAVTDFVGRTLAVATQEGELFVLNRAGNVRWKTGLPRPAVSLEIDALGRWLVFGQATGEISRIDLEASSRSSRPAEPRAASGAGAGGELSPSSSNIKAAPAESGPARSRPSGSAVRPSPGGSVRAPVWSVPAVDSPDRAETAVLVVLDEPPRIGLMSSTDRLEVFTTDGHRLGRTPPLSGVGRLLRADAGWIAAATDRKLLLFDARNNAVHQPELHLVQLTHLEIRPDRHGLAIVQERDRVGRATTAGRWVWRTELDSAVEEMALGPDGLIAVTTDDGRLRIFDPGGNPVGDPRPSFGEPLALIGAPERSPSALAWISLSRHGQVVRGHDREGRVMWESPVPWESWQLDRAGGSAVVLAPDGRAISYDGSGRLAASGRDPAPPGVLFPGPEGQVCRVYRRGPHLICDDLSGRVRWRALAEADPGRGPIAAGRLGVAALIGRELAWFPSQPSTADRPISQKTTDHVEPLPP